MTAEPKCTKSSTEEFQVSISFNPRPVSDLAKGRECLY